MTNRVLNFVPQNFTEGEEIVDAFAFRRYPSEYRALIMEALLASCGGAFDQQDGYYDATIDLVDGNKISKEIKPFIAKSDLKLLRSYIFEASLYTLYYPNHPQLNEYQVRTAHNVGGDLRNVCDVGLTITLDRQFDTTSSRMLVDSTQVNDPRITMLMLKSS